MSGRCLILTLTAPPQTDELATFCIRAMTAAGELRIRTAVRRTVTRIVSGLEP